MKGRDRRTELQRLEDLEHERDALDLRLGGMSYRDIAEHQGCHPGTAHDRVQRALARLVPTERAEQVRTLEAERLDAVLTRLLRRIADPEVDTAALVLLTGAYVKTVDRKAKLLGLDTPVQQRLTITSELDAEIEGLVAALRGDQDADA